MSFLSIVPLSWCWRLEGRLYFSNVLFLCWFFPNGNEFSRPFASRLNFYKPLWYRVRCGRRSPVLDREGFTAWKVRT